MGEQGETAGSPAGSEVVETLRRYQTLVNEVDDGIYQLDADGRFVAVNDAMVEASGYDRADLLGKHVSLVVDDADIERFEGEIRTRLEAGEDPDSTIMLAVETADGERIPCEVRFSLLVEDGTFEGTVGVVRQVGGHSGETIRLRSIWETYESLASVINEADIGVFVLDENFDVVWIDETIEAYFGIDRAEVIGRGKRTLIEETIRDRLADPQTFVETVFATYDDNSYVEQFECHITAGEGRTERWLEHRSKPIESGRYAGGRIELYYDITDRKESEQARRESERRFETLVDAVDEYAIFMLDSDGCVVSWNEGAERIKGYQPSEIHGKHLSLFYTDEERADGVPERNLARARAHGSVEDEGWRVGADGSRFWANVTITAIYDGGELRGYAKVTRDMTDRREREQRLRREYDLTERILETSPVGIAVVNSDGSVARANERMAELLDLPGEVDSYTTAQLDMYDAGGELIPPEKRPVARVFETGETVTNREVRLERSDGSQQWLSINARPIEIEGGSPEQVVETATDVTGLKELAERRKHDLEEREKELAAVRLATKLLEAEEQPVDGLLGEFTTILPQFFQAPERTEARISVGSHEASTERYERLDGRIVSRGRTANGTPITVDVVLQDGASDSPDGASDSPDSSETFLDKERELIEMLTTLLKLHFDRREYVEELRASNERLEQFAHAASHDLQEPLRMVSSYLQLIEGRYGEDLDEEGEEFLDFAVDGADRMREMIDGLLEYSRVETRGEPFEPTDLDAVLADVLDDLQVSIAEHDAEIAVEPLPTVEGDPSQLRQVFQNLLDNAIEYSGEGSPHVEITSERDGDEWVISVSDRGVGLDTDNVDRVFEVFQRLHTYDEHPGTGIGLALCRRIVERHGGEMWVDSEPGEGSTFSFTLPVERD